MKKFNSVKDSGKREDFNTGSRRDTSEGKPRYDLISPIALYRLAMHTSNGATKYGDRNWEKGQPLNRYIESLERHLQKMKVGLEDEDHESAIMWNIMAYMHTKALVESGELPKELDNLPKYSESIQNLLIQSNTDEAENKK